MARIEVALYPRRANSSIAARWIPSRVSGPRRRDERPSCRASGLVLSTNFAPCSAKLQQLLGLLLRGHLTPEGAREVHRYLDQCRIGGREHATAQVRDVFESGANPGGAMQQRQPQHAGVVTPDARHGPERAGGQGMQHRLQRLGGSVYAPWNPEYEIDAQRRRQDPLFQPAHRADDMPDVEGLDLERDPRLGRALDDPPAGGRRSDERLVAEVHRAGLDARDVWLCLQAGGPLLDRHVVGATRRDHGEQVAAGADSLDHVVEELGASAGGAVVLTHVQVDDGGPGRARLDARIGDLLGRVRDVRVVLAKDVGPGHRDGDDHGLAVPSHSLSSSVMGRGARCAGSHRTKPNSASTTTCPLWSRMRSLVVTLERPSSRTAHSTVTASNTGSISSWKL